MMMMIVLDESSLLKCVIILNLILFCSMRKLLDEVFHLLLNKVYTRKHSQQRRRWWHEVQQVMRIKKYDEKIKRRRDKIEFCWTLNYSKVCSVGLNRNILDGKCLFKNHFNHKARKFTFTSSKRHATSTFDMESTFTSTLHIQFPFIQQ